MDKVKAIEKVKCSVHERKEQEKALGKIKREIGFAGNVSRPKKRGRFDSPSRVKAFVGSNAVAHYEYCGRRHPVECQKKTGACLRCGSLEHKVHECPQRFDPILASILTIVTSTIQSPRVISSSIRGRGFDRANNSTGRDRGAPDRGTTQTKAR